MKKILLIIVVSILSIVCYINCYAYDYKSSVILTVCPQNLTFEIVSLNNDNYLIKNDSTGPIVINSNIIIFGKSSKTINTDQTIIADWYK